MADPSEERIRELERRDPRLDRLEAGIRAAKERLKLLRRFPQGETIPAFFTLNVLNRCGFFNFPIDNSWSIRIEHPADPSIVYDDWSVIQQDNGTLRFSFLGGESRRLIRVVMEKAGWAPVNFVDEVRPDEGRFRTEYTHTFTATIPLQVTSWCNRGTTAVPVFDPLPGVHLTAVTNAPVMHAFFFRVFGSPSGGFVRLKWGDTGSVFKDIPWNADLATLRSVFAGPLTLGGVTYTLAGSNYTIGRLLPQGLMFVGAAQFPEDGIFLLFQGNLSGIDFSGAASVFANFLEGPNPTYAQWYTGDYYPRENAGRGLAVGTTIAEATTDAIGAAFLPNVTHNNGLDVLFDSPGKCVSRHRVSGVVPYCSANPRTVRFCFGSKSITLAPNVGGPLSNWRWSWGRHSSPTIASGNTSTINIAETDDNGFLSSNCGMTLATGGGFNGYPQVNAVVTITQLGPNQWSFECIEPPPWCCNDRSVSGFALNRDGDADWAGVFPVIANPSGLCINPKTIIGSTRWAVSDIGGNCDCHDPSMWGGMFIPKRCALSLIGQWVDSDRSQNLFTGSVVETKKPVDISGGGSGLLVAQGTSGGDLYWITDPYSISGPTFTKETSGPGGGGSIRYTKLVYHYTVAQIQLYPFGKSGQPVVTPGFWVTLQAVIDQEYSQIDPPFGPITPGRPPGTVANCPQLSCALTRDKIFVRISGVPGDPSCDYHVDAHCNTTLDPYAAPPQVFTNFSGTGPA